MNYFVLNGILQVRFWAVIIDDYVHLLELNIYVGYQVSIDYKKYWWFLGRKT